MKRFRFLFLASALSVLFAGAASAVPVDFTFLATNTSGGAFPTNQTFVPSLPISGAANARPLPTASPLGMGGIAVRFDVRTTTKVVACARS